MADWSNEKAKEIIKNLLRQAESERALENLGTADLFDAQAAKIAAKYSVDISTIDISFTSASAQVVNELGQTVISNIFNRTNARTNVRKIWFEELAKVVAEGYGCKVNPNLQDGSVIFFGYDFDREIASFMFVKLAEVANELCDREMKLVKNLVGKAPFYDFKSKSKVVNPKEWMGNDVFVDNFHASFREEIERMLSSRTIEEDKRARVEEYFNQEKDDYSYRYYYHSYRSQNLQQSPFNEQAANAGRICGYNVAHKASKTPSALVVKKSIISNKNKAIILVDNSGSMDWGGSSTSSPMNQAIEGTIEYAQTAIVKSYQVDVVAFSDNAVPIVKDVEKLDDSIKTKIRNIHATNGTNLTDALKYAQSRFLNRSVERVIMVVTDGIPNNEDSALQIANDCKRIGIKIMAIGCGTANQEFLDKLTSPGCGLLVDNTRLMLGIGEMAQKLA